MKPLVPGAKISGGAPCPVTDQRAFISVSVNGIVKLRSVLFIVEKYTVGAPEMTIRHGALRELTKRSASTSTGLRALKFSPVSANGGNEIASSAEEIAYMCVVFNDVRSSPFSSVVTGVALIINGAPAIGVSSMRSLKVTGTDGGVGVIVGVIVGVLEGDDVGVIVGVGVTVGVFVGVGVIVGVYDGV